MHIVTEDISYLPGDPVPGILMVFSGAVSNVHVVYTSIPVGGYPMEQLVHFTVLGEFYVSYVLTNIIPAFGADEVNVVMVRL